ncbi:hypothetical protein I6J18_20725 [Peribacillus psychrosaccharolyticus]|uniref:Uncharacterized protein n=1 Tax=Peribacillus psychrosaccharolyticus TaxID=1407 RepID=A0A974NLH4_PERPY|nr:hypothetical protein [Peribacillus psychrosaccharolyticus]MEC2054262.1 hypothetical protein [Peribacillus psychrosaccharolyticus]MED3744510.1 hypothetical protein [Peribacillus psychrosaccharolyticus]QQS99974.1 hypothetical protein I6J18_20725 [Peribacillus psychrosaccharolyticus]
MDMNTNPTVAESFTNEDNITVIIYGEPDCKILAKKLLDVYDRIQIKKE